MVKKDDVLKMSEENRRDKQSRYFGVISKSFLLNYL